MKKRFIIYIIFVIYLLIIFRITVFRGSTLDERQFNFVLFADLIKVFKEEKLSTFLILFLGNIGWFVPYGFLLPSLLKRKNLFAVLLFGLGLSLVIEGLQFALKKGVCEIDDLILNTTGAALGYAAYKTVIYLRNRKPERKI